MGVQVNQEADLRWQSRQIHPTQVKTISPNILQLTAAKKRGVERHRLHITLPREKFPAGIADLRWKTRTTLSNTSEVDLITGAALSAREDSRRSKIFTDTLSGDDATSPMVNINENNSKLHFKEILLL